MRIPTVTIAAAVTDDLNRDKMAGARNTEIIKRIPVTMAVIPVLPPRPMPVALSTYAVTVLDPNSAPMMPPIASLMNALLIPSVLPSSLTYPHSFAMGIRVPVVSKNVTKSRENKIRISDEILLKSSPNPERNPPNTLKFRLNEIHVFGIVGRAASGDVNPTKEKTTPKIAVKIKPKNTAAGTFLTYNASVMIMLIDASNTCGEAMFPSATTVVGLETIIPAFTSPKNARKKPIPEPIASFKSFGIAFRMVSLNPITVISKKIMLERNTAARAAFHDNPIPRTMVYVNSAFRPIPGARPTG